MRVMTGTPGGQAADFRPVSRSECVGRLYVLRVLRDDGIQEQKTYVSTLNINSSNPSLIFANPTPSSSLILSSDPGKVTTSIKATDPGVLARLPAKTYLSNS